MRIDLKVAGFEGRNLQVDYSAWGGARLFLDGKEAPQAPGKGVYLLKRDDGSEAIARFKGLLLDPGSQLSIDGKTVRVLPPLPWYQWVWAGLPLVLLMAGAVGGAAGALLFFVNSRIFRSEIPVVLRYLFAGAITSAALCTAALFAPPRAGPEMGRQPKAAEMPAPQLIGAAALGIGRSAVHIDNDSADALELQIDSERWGILEPYAIELIELEHGKHEFRFLKGSTEVDRVEAQLPERKAVVVNPRGNARYIIKSYAVTRAGISPSPDQIFADLRTAKVVEADLGLLDSAPESAQDSKSPAGPAPDPAHTRTKVVKEAPETLGVEKAMAMIESSAAYRSADIKRAFDALAAAPPRPEIRALLLESAESPNDMLAGGALDSLQSYAAGVSEERLLRWLRSGRATLVFGSARILMHRNDGALLRANFRALRQDSQDSVLRALHEGVRSEERPSSSLRRSLLAAALEMWPVDAAVKLLPMVGDDSLHLDDDFVRRVDKFIGSLASEQHRKPWNSTWWKKLAKEAPRIKSSWITGRLVEIAQRHRDDMQKDVREDAVAALVERREAGRLAAVYGRLEPVTRSQALTALEQRCAAEKSMRSGNLPLAMEALSDKDPMNRRRAFRLLTKFAASRPGVEEAVRAAFLRETDGNTRSEMEGRLTQMLLAGLKAASPDQQVAFLLAAPTPNLSAQVIERLMMDAERTAHLRKIEQGLKASPNRAWIISDLGRYKRFYPDPAFAAAYDAVVRMGLVDADAAVRAAAVRARTESLDLMKGGSVEFAAVFADHATGPHASELALEYERALAVRYGRTYRNDGYTTQVRKLAFDKLMAIAGSGNEMAAITALEGMREVFEIQALTRLAGLFTTASSEQRKIRILAAAGVNDDQALSVVAPMYEKALADPSPKVRAAALDAVQKWCAGGARRARMQAAVQTAASKENEPALKARLEQWLKK